MGRTVACIGTGPSLTREQIETARAKGWALFGCNLVFREVADLDVLFACNGPFWDYYLCADHGLREHAAEKWTSDREAAEKWGLRYIRGRSGRGLSTDPAKLHHGHSSGFQLLGLAYLMGAARIVLLGYDVRYAADYSASERAPGSTPRHFFGEYPSALRHWPRVGIVDGVLTGLVSLYESVAAQGAVEVINCSPGSALECFPRRDVRDVD